MSFVAMNTQMRVTDTRKFRGHPKEVVNQLRERNHLPALGVSLFPSTKPNEKPDQPFALTAVLHQKHSAPGAIHLSEAPGQQQYIAHQSACAPLPRFTSRSAPWTGHLGTVMATVASPCYSVQNEVSPSIGTPYEQRNTRRAKRKRTNDDSDEEWDEKNEENNSGSSELRQAGLRWACPFYKLDSWNQYRCLEKYHFRRVADVKQHILRCHTLGNYYCQRCWMKWKSEEPWKIHIIEDACTEVTVPEILDEIEIPTLDELPKGRTNEEKWYSLWDAFFKGHEPPLSPFVKSGIAEPIFLLRSRAVPLLMAQLPSLLEAIGIKVDGNAALQLHSEIEKIIFEPTRPAKRRRLHPDRSADTAAVEPGFHKSDNETYPSTIDVLPIASQSSHGEVLPDTVWQSEKVQSLSQASATFQLQQPNLQVVQSSPSCAAATSPASLWEAMTPFINPALESMHEPTYSPSELDLTAVPNETVIQMNSWTNVKMDENSPSHHVSTSSFWSFGEGASNDGHNE